MTELGFTLKSFIEDISLEVPESLNLCRAVTPEEIARLKSTGSHCEDWSLVWVSPDTDISLIRRCSFRGLVKIHLSDGLLYNTVLENCSVAGPARIESTGLVSGLTLLPGCIIRFAGRVVWNSAPSFLTGSIQGGLETGERSLPILPAMDHEQAAWLASAEGRAEASELASALAGIQDGVKGFIGPSSVIESCPSVENTLILGSATISGAAGVRGSILYQGSRVSDGALVRSSALQWNSKVDSLAVVENSVVGECSTVERHGKITSSFLGADSVLAEGEITASIVGPFTGMHHQSLLIAALWPGGRGNVGYGANVGSNHTSRLPDQEIRPGTGFFFGLSASVKFPSDFSRSPYSVIATGITTLPQRVEFPFSLICLPDARPEGVPEGWMRLIPGWMLHSNLYAILRNLWKYESRKSAVHTPLETCVFSKEVLEMMRDAASRLESADGFTVPGCGKNYVTPEDRVAGIQVYRKCLRFFALIEKSKAEVINPSESGELLDLVAQARKTVNESRARDLARGKRIIGDYGLIHPAPGEDPFLRVFEAKAYEMEKKLKEIR